MVSKNVSETGTKILRNSAGKALEQRLSAGAGEVRVVDFYVGGDDGYVGAEVLAEGGEEGGVGFRRVTGLARGADHVDGAEREQDGYGSGVAVDFFGEDAAELGALGGRRAHESDLRVVLVEQAAGEFGGDGGAPTEVLHVEAAGGDDRGGF